MGLISSHGSRSREVPPELGFNPKPIDLGLYARHFCDTSALLFYAVGM
jgi:hypothetical protein